MAETEALIGYDSTLEISEDGGSVWSEVMEVFDMTPPSETGETVEATHYKSPNKTREHIPGFIAPGEWTFEMNFVPGSPSDALVTRIKGKKVKGRITYPNAVMWTFDCIRTGYEPAAPNDDKLTASVGFQISGSVLK